MDGESAYIASLHGSQMQKAGLSQAFSLKNFPAMYYAIYMKTKNA
jgi:hypothetical protein